ncbi:MAG: ATP-dependent Clp protease ATP-binding subunit, partial [Mogibacterium sp.]|nr:ATP-dependent Clp protease ATP-binding subunit [Mogibacterium sp.]
MSDYIAGWHRELGIFSRIKPVIIVEGNVLDVYRYPVEGSVAKGSILRLPEYLHYCGRDLGYETIGQDDSMQGFCNPCEDGHIQAFSQLTGTRLDGRFIRSDFKGRNNSATAIIRNAVSQTRTPVAIVMNLASRYITSPDNIDQPEVDSYTNLILASLEAKDVRTGSGMLKNL